MIRPRGYRGTRRRPTWTGFIVLATAYVGAWTALSVALTLAVAR